MKNSQEHTNESTPKEKKPFRINMHIVLIAVVVIFLCGIIYKIVNFGIYIDQDEIFEDGPGTYEDNYDEILPLLNSEGDPVPVDYSDGLTIVAFGNHPFSDGRDSEDNLLNIIARETNATVYNCSITGSHMAAYSDVFDGFTNPTDAYSLYWLAYTAAGVDMEGHFIDAEKTLGDDLAPEAWDVYNMLTSIDFNEVDVITIMYDATDYLMGFPIYNFDQTTDITQFAGNLEASLEVFQTYFPHIRIIVLGPPYAYAINENGEYVSSFIYDYGQDDLSLYSIMAWQACASRSVTFIDNLYGTFNEMDTEEYLTDHLHLNQTGREEVAKRFVHALNYYNEN